MNDLSATESMAPALQAALDDSRVREIEKQVLESWSELATIAIRFRDQELWRFVPRPGSDVGFHSFDDWLVDAAPCSRATVYRGMGVLSALPDVATEELRQIEIGNAVLLTQLSSGVRRDPEVLEAAKDSRNSGKLREVVHRKFKDQHIEMQVEKKCRWDESAWAVIWEEVKLTRDEENDENLSFSSIVELWASERKQARERMR